MISFLHPNSKKDKLVKKWISKVMLRHYDEIGLLKPASVDNFTSYRYYDETQLLNEYGDNESLKKYLALQVSQKKEELQVLQDQITLIENAVKELGNNENPQNCDIAVKKNQNRRIMLERSCCSIKKSQGTPPYT